MTIYCGGCNKRKCPNLHSGVVLDECTLYLLGLVKCVLFTELQGIRIRGF